MYDFIIVGAGIVGLSVGLAIHEKNPGSKIVLIDKEKEVASHQTGHNSGVIHSGIYYKPGSYKALFARQGSRSMTEFCREHQIEHDICGKVIVAANEAEIPHLENLYQRGLQNELSITRLSKEELLEREPHVNGVGAIHVPMAGIVNYRKVSEKMAEILTDNNGEIKLSKEVRTIEEGKDEVVVETDRETIRGRYFINCAGLQSDRIANMTGYHVDMKIVPFRGEYYKLKEDKKDLVNNLIYPVPNPDFPFLGVHFTRMIGGAVDVGPNAVLSLKREGYRKTDFHLKDFAEVMTYPGFWKIASKYMKEGMGEMMRSFSKKKFVENVQVLMPAIQEADLVPADAGVRAQALTSDGELVDDFFIVNGKRSIHVCNAPSPAATASLEIGKEVVRKIPSDHFERSKQFS
ncbi:L-2-hydroxyglutarate oxidase [Rossellomorea marisflavi]|uniref:L-2-hydroxyglutarate oxidase n=1 Tax=Rossellomorea marisflavi TaxID=189381 RepID=UPI0034592DFB